MERIDSCDPHLRFTWEISEKNVKFLDLEIEINNGNFVTTIYKKPTDRNTLLEYGSYHPITLRKNLPVGQFFRLRRLCSSTADYKIKSGEMWERFTNRGYPQKIIKQAYKRALYSARENLLQPKKQKDKTEGNIFLSIEYSPLSQQIRGIVNKNWKILGLHPALKKRPLTTFRRRNNLRDILVKSFLEPMKIQNFLEPIKGGHQKCGHCAQCVISKKVTSFRTKNHEREINLRHHTTCATSGVIYCVSCPCERLYVGKTERMLRTRMSEHRSNIRNKKENAPMVKHCVSYGHSCDEIRFWGLEIVKKSIRGGNWSKTLLQREQWWLYFLDTDGPNGMNECADLSCFL